MATPNAAPPSQLEMLEQALAAHQRERANRAAVAVAALAWVAAALIPFDDLLGGLIVGVCCLAGLGIVGIAARRAWPARAPGLAGILLLSAALTAFVRFAVPTIDSDSLLVRIGAYVAFCAVYAGYLFLGQRLMQFSGPLEDRPGYGFWRHSAFTFALLGVLIAALYLLARFFSLTLVLLLVVANLLTVLTTYVARKALGSEAVADRRQAWTTTELFAGQPLLVTVVLLLPMIASVVFPILMGVVYFTSTVPSDELTTWVFRLSLIGLVFSGLPLGIFTLSSTLASPNVNETIRVRQLVIALGALLDVGLLLSLLLWSFGISSEEETASTPGVSFSPVVVVTLLAYFFLAVFLPYAIGTVRSRRQLLRFLRVIERALGRMAAALERPHPAAVESELGKIKSGAAGAELESMHHNAVLALAEEGERLPASVREQLPAALKAKEGLPEEQQAIYRRMRAEEPTLVDADDPRLRFWGQLRGVAGGVDEIELTLAHVPAAEQERLRREWAEFLAKRRGELQSYIAERPRTRLPAWLTLGGLVAPVVSVILDQFGNWIWIQVADSFPG